MARCHSLSGSDSKGADELCFHLHRFFFCLLSYILAFNLCHAKRFKSDSYFCFNLQAHCQNFNRNSRNPSFIRFRAYSLVLRIKLRRGGSKASLNSQHPYPTSRSFSFRKSSMKHVSNVHFYEYKWHLLYSPWLSLSRSLRVS